MWGCGLNEYGWRLVNPQVEHNLAVVEYLRGQGKHPKVLVEALRSVKVGG